MQKVMIIANEFPPIGGSGVQRSANLVKHLPAQGYQPVVISRAYTHGLYDDTLCRDLPQSAQIYRFASFDFLNRPGLVGKLLRFVATRLFIPDGELFWYLRNRKKTLKILDEQAIKIVYSTSYPYSDHLMARYIKKRRPDIRWVTDFRDEWTNNPYFEAQFYMRLRAPFERQMEADIVKCCDYLITNTPFMLANFLADASYKKQVACFIPNGYNEMDFVGYQLNNQYNERFRIIYMGALYGNRRPDHALQAISDLLTSGAIARDKLQLEFIGNYHQHIMQGLIDKYDLADVMSITPYMAHDALLKHMSQANLLLLIESEKNFYTGKVFEYIRMQIPILATVPVDGAAAQVVNETKTGSVVPFADVAAIGAALQSAYRSWQRGAVDFTPDQSAIARYSWQAHATSIASCFEDNR